MMSDVQYKVVDEPPPEMRGRHDGSVTDIMELLDAHPGSWLEFEAVRHKVAQGRATNLRRKGYEAKTRSVGRRTGGLYAVLYARKP